MRFICIAPLLRSLDGNQLIEIDDYTNHGMSVREEAGVMGAGPYRVITNQALFGFDKYTRRMMLLEYLPGKSPEAIQDLVDFELLMAADVKEMAVPTEHDIMLPRTKCDPEGFFLKRKIIDK
jgi:glutaconate CoA-transferase, subunit B